jgi:hypothetical protein
LNRFIFKLESDTIYKVENYKGFIMKKIILSLLAGLGILFGAQQIDVYTYHDHAPFVIDKKDGLSHDPFAKVVNEYAK